MIMDFVTFEITLKLREKGFREECIAYYHTDGELLYNRDQYRGGNYKSLLRSYNSLPKNPIGCEQIDAPTISQVLKWLREKKKIHIEPCILADADTDADGKVIKEFTYWSFSIVSIATGDMIYFEYEHIDDMRFDSYEQAALAGIEHVLYNLI